MGLLNFDPTQIANILQAILPTQPTQQSSSAGALSLLNPTIDPTSGTMVNSQAAPSSFNLESILAVPAEQIASTSSGSGASSQNSLNYSPLINSTQTTSPQSTISKNGLII